MTTGEQQQDAAAVETTTAVMEISIEVAARGASDPLDGAATEMIGRVSAYLSDADGSFMTDYGATAEEVAQARRSGEWGDVTWGGYEGPYALKATVRPTAGTVEDLIVEAIADLNSDALLDPSLVDAEYLRGQLELAVALLGYDDDGFSEKIDLLRAAAAAGPSQEGAADLLQDALGLRIPGQDASRPAGEDRLSAAELYGLNTAVTRQLADEHGLEGLDDDQEDALNGVVLEIASLRAKERAMVRSLAEDLRRSR